MKINKNMLLAVGALLATTSFTVQTAEYSAPASPSKIKGSPSRFSSLSRTLVYATIAEQERAITELNQEIKKVNEQYRITKDENASLIRKVTSLEDHMGCLYKEHQEVDHAVVNAVKAGTHYERFIAELTKEKSELDAQIRCIKESSDQSLSDLRARIFLLQEENQKLNEEVASLKKLNKAFEARAGQTAGSLGKLGDLESIVFQQQDAFADLEKRFLASQKTIQTQKEQIAQLERTVRDQQDLLSSSVASVEQSLDFVGDTLASEIAAVEQSIASRSPKKNNTNIRDRYINFGCASRTIKDERLEMSAFKYFSKK